jgi:hypothetical protein
MTTTSGTPSDIAGRALAAVTSAILLVRRPRPIHSRGVVLYGSVRWLGRRGSSGIGWIDEPPEGGTQSVAARVSRGIGLPPALPDIIGLALRLDTPDGAADLELSSTGLGVPGRFLLVPHRSASSPWYGTLLPYRGTRGPVLVAARPRRPAALPPVDTELAARLTAEDWVLDLLYATPTSRWRRFAELRLSATVAPDGAPVVDASPHAEVAGAELRFDAVLRPLPGAENYRWTAELRRPAYRRAQRS